METILFKTLQHCKKWELNVETPEYRENSYSDPTITLTIYTKGNGKIKMYITTKEFLYLKKLPNLKNYYRYTQRDR